MECSAPITKQIINGWHYLQKIKQEYSSLREVKKENLQLRKKLAELSQKEVFYRELLLTNQRLESLLRLKQKLAYPSLTANVISYTPYFNPKLVVIDKGRKDGLKLHFPVLNIQGVVGQIAMLSSHYAKVLTIIDVNSRIGVKSQRTRVNGVFIGTGINTGEVKYIMKDKDVKVDDLFITSGLDDIFPKGLLVGKVISISEPKTGLFKKIVVKTSIDFCCLEEVIVLLKPSQWFSPHGQN